MECLKGKTQEILQEMQLFDCLLKNFVGKRIESEQIPLKRPLKI